MVQSFNWSGIKNSLLVLSRPSLVLPQLKVKTISDINFKALYESGIRGIIFDKDNCLTTPYALTIHPTIKPGWNSCLDIFGKDRVVILSNSSGTIEDDPQGIEAKEVTESLGVDVLIHKEKKPGCGKEVLTTLSKRWNLNSDQIAMIGDRLFTDIMFGNLNNMYTIWTTEILNSSKDNRVAAKIRNLEYQLASLLNSLKLQPKPHPSSPKK